MSEHVPLDYERITTPRGPSLGRLVLWLFVGIFVIGTVVFALLPSLPHGYPTPPRRRCANNLRQIGLAIMLYSDQNKGQYPGKVGSLILTQGLGAEVFVCPASSDAVQKARPVQQAATLLSGTHCSYVYVGAGVTSSANSDTVVAFELSDNHGTGQGGNVLYADAHVEWQRFDTLVQLVPELEAGRNPPMLRPLTEAQAKMIYDQKWVPQLSSIKNGFWAASLPRPSTRPSAEGN